MQAALCVLRLFHPCVSWTGGGLPPGECLFVPGLDLAAPRPLADALHRRLAAFGFERFYWDIFVTSPDPEAEAEARRFLGDRPGEVRRVEVPVGRSGRLPPLRAADELPAYGARLLEVGGEGTGPILLATTRTLLVDRAEIEDLLRTAERTAAFTHINIPGMAEAAALSRKALEASFLRGAHRPPAGEAPVALPPAPPLPFPFDLCAAYEEVIAELRREPPERWSRRVIEDLARDRPELFSTHFRHVGIELTNDDNVPARLRSPRRISRRPVGRMDRPTWEALLDDLAGHRAWPLSIDLWDFGEPLLHPEAAAFIEEAAGCGIRVDLRTNGTLLSAALAERLVAAPVDAVFIRLDGLSEKTWAAVHGDATAGPRAVEGLRRLCEAKRRASHDPPRPIIAVEITEMDETAAELDAFLERYGAVARWEEEQVRARRGPPSAEERARLLREAEWPVEHAIIRHDNLYRGRVGRVGAWAPLRRFPCRQWWEGPYVLWDGTVVPCREDIDAERPLGKVSDGLAVLWRGEVARELRRTHARRSWGGHPLCGSCAEWYYGFA